MLRTGFARIDITPGTNSDLLGYEFRQQHLPPGNAGAHDPLTARVLVLDDGSTLSAIVSLDLCILLVPLARHLRAAIATKLSTTPDRVMIACSHTHSGPFPKLAGDAGQNGPLKTFSNPDTLHPDQAYAQFLEAQLLEATGRAMGLTYPVTLAAQEAPCGIAYTRRVLTPEGVRLCWNPHEFPHLRPLPSADPMLTVVALRQVAGSRQVLLWSTGCHPVTLGKTSRVVSADWPGLACRQLEQSLPHTDAMFILGPCGDTHPWIATQDNPDLLEPVASAASASARLLTHGLHASPGDLALTCASQTLTFARDEVDLMAWRIGPPAGGGVTIATCPVELFAALAADLRKRLPAPLIVATNTNGWTGYWPNAAAFPEGDYEVNAAKAHGRSPGDGEKLMDALADLARQVQAPAK